MKRLVTIFTITLALLTIDYASAADSTTADNTIDKTETTGRVSANDCHIITYDATKGEKIVVEHMAMAIQTSHYMSTIRTKG